MKSYVWIILCTIAISQLPPSCAIWDDAIREIFDILREESRTKEQTSVAPWTRPSATSDARATNQTPSEEEKPDLGGSEERVHGFLSVLQEVLQASATSAAARLSALLYMLPSTQQRLLQLTHTCPTAALHFQFSNRIMEILNFEFTLDEPEIFSVMVSEQHDSSDTRLLTSRLHLPVIAMNLHTAVIALLSAQTIMPYDFRAEGLSRNIIPRLLDSGVEEFPIIALGLVDALEKSLMTYECLPEDEYIKHLNSALSYAKQCDLAKVLPVFENQGSFFLEHIVRLLKSIFENEWTVNDIRRFIGTDGKLQELERQCLEIQKRFIEISIIGSMKNTDSSGILVALDQLCRALSAAVPSINLL